MARSRSARKYNYKVSLEGAKELDKWLENAGDKAAEYIDEAVRDGGEITLRSAKSNAPVGKTGRLQLNIVMNPVTRRAGRAGSKKRIVSGAVNIGAARTKKGAEDDAYYGAFQELGTKYIDAKFFLRDAVDRNKQAISQAITSKIAKLFRR